MMSPLCLYCRLSLARHLPIWSHQAGRARPLAVRVPPAGQVAALGLRLLPFGDEIFEGGAAIADHRHVDMDVLVDRAGVDVDVDLLRARRAGGVGGGNGVVEA